MYSLSERELSGQHSQCQHVKCYTLEEIVSLVSEKGIGQTDEVLDRTSFSVKLCPFDINTIGDKSNLTINDLPKAAEHGCFSDVLHILSSHEDYTGLFEISLLIAASVGSNRCLNIMVNDRRFNVDDHLLDTILKCLEKDNHVGFHTLSPHIKFLHPDKIIYLIEKVISVSHIDYIYSLLSMIPLDAYGGHMLFIANHCSRYDVVQLLMSDDRIRKSTSNPNECK